MGHCHGVERPRIGWWARRTFTVVLKLLGPSAVPLGSRRPEQVLLLSVVLRRWEVHLPKLSVLGWRDLQETAAIGQGWTCEVLEERTREEASRSQCKD